MIVTSTYNNIYSAPTQQMPFRKKMSDAVSRAFASVEQGWNYAGKTFLLSRHVLNGTIKSCSWFLKRCCCTGNTRLSDAVRRLKLFTIISIPINLKQIPGLAGRVKQNFQWRDPKETLLAGISLSVLLMDTIDTLATFTTAALQTLSIAVPAIVSAVGTPLAYGMLTLGASNRIVRIRDMTKFLKETGKVNVSGTPEEVKTALQLYLKSNTTGGKHEESVVAKKSNERAVQTIKSLETLVAKEEFSHEEVREATVLLADISRHIRRERKIHAAYLTANVVSLTALSFFSLSIGTVSPFVLMAASVAIRLSTQLYQDKKS